MIQIRKSNERGHFNHGWLDTYHTFSFADYYDPEHMGFKALRVINEDRVAPGQGFGTHSHRDMEIITCILSGSLEHKDSMGNTSAITPGEIQRMSAGTGVTHSEFNPSKKEAVHLLQIWIFPEKKGATPSYEQRAFDPAGKKNRLRLIVSNDGREGSVTAHQDVSIFDAHLEKGKAVSVNIKKGRDVWIQLTAGRLYVGDELISEGDGAAVTEEKALSLKADSTSEFLLFDL